MKEELIKQLKSYITNAWVKGSEVYFSMKGEGVCLSVECVIDIVRDEDTIFMQGESFYIELNEKKIASVFYDDSEGVRFDLISESGTSYIYEFSTEER